MAGKNFWQDKWLHDQYNQRNPGQANLDEAVSLAEKLAAVSQRTGSAALKRAASAALVIVRPSTKAS